VHHYNHKCNQFTGIFASGDSQATVANGTTYVNGSSVAMVNMQGNQGTAKEHANGTGMMIDAAAANSITSMDQKGQTGACN
jgi:hypothetical protein